MCSWATASLLGSSGTSSLQGECSLSTRLGPSSMLLLSKQSLPGAQQSPTSSCVAWKEQASCSVAQDQLSATKSTQPLWKPQPPAEAVSSTLASVLAWLCARLQYAGTSFVFFLIPQPWARAVSLQWLHEPGMFLCRPSLAARRR